MASARVLQTFLFAVVLFLASWSSVEAVDRGIIRGKPSVGWKSPPKGGWCRSTYNKNGCYRLVFGWDITGNVNLNQFQVSKYCVCATACAAHNGYHDFKQQCQTWVYNPATSHPHGHGSCTLYADISPGFAYSGAFFNETYHASPVPYIGSRGVSGIMLAAGNPHGHGVAGYIC